MKGDKIKANVLSIQMIPNAEKELLRALHAPDHLPSLGILTTDLDDVSYAAMDEATKESNVRVIYAKSMYAGALNASTKLAGEFIGILAGQSPEDIKCGLKTAVYYMEQEAFFYSADDENRVTYFAHCISQTGSYLSEVAGIPKGQPIAYLIGPPNEAICGLDEALKRAGVHMKVFYGPPTETNFAGGLLTGSREDCEEACSAFSEIINRISDNPKIF